MGSWRRLLGGSPQNPLAKIGWAQDPTKGLALPANDGDRKYRYSDLPFDQAIEQAAYLFSDGGCSKEWHPKLNRASWAVIAAGCNGEHTAACLGPVWRHLPQTSQAGEMCGMAATRQLAKGVAKKLFSDCSSVVKAVQKAGAWTRKSFYAGLLRESEQEKERR